MICEEEEVKEKEEDRLGEKEERIGGGDVSG